MTVNLRPTYYGKLRAPPSCYRWWPCGDTRHDGFGTGLLITRWSEADIEMVMLWGSRASAALAPNKMTWDGVRKVAGIKLSKSTYYVTERVAEALTLWNKGGFGEMSRGEFLLSVVAVAWQLDENDALKAAGRRHTSSAL